MGAYPLNVSAKGVKLLQVLDKHGLMRAAWNHRELSELWQRGLVNKVNMVQLNGRSAVSSAWSISVDGQAVLADIERGR